MQPMPNLKLSRKEVKQIIGSSKRQLGGESIICKTDNPHTLYKIFRRKNKVIEMKDNKFQKLKRLHELSLEHSVYPLRTLSQNGMLIGYEMTYNPDDISFYPSTYPKDLRLKFLRETKEILEYFARNNLVFGDVAYRNILYNRKTEEFKFCDMDNVQLEGMPIDLIGNTTSLSTYANSCGITSKADAYVHNIMALDTLGIEYPFYDDEDIDYYFESPASIIVDSMDIPQTFQGEYLVKYLKK